MWPALLARHSAVPGGDPGDNFAALWNVWWFVEGTQVTGWPYWTPLLFAPVGTQLALHTHATTHSLLAWVWTPFTSLPAAHNLTLTLGLALNGLLAYVLALRCTGRVVAAAAAGILFAACAAVQLRALGHLNLVHAWVLPLFALALMHFAAGPGAVRAVLLGAAGAIVVYTDYYYAVYAGLLALLWTLTLLLSVNIERFPRPAGQRFAPGLKAGSTGVILLVLIVLDLVVIAIIALTGGTSLDLGFARVSLRGLRNPLTLFWFLTAAWILWRYRWRISAGWRNGRLTLRDATPALAAAATFLFLASPLVVALARVIAAGDYTTQTVLWRSSPPGGDLLTVVLGHPRHVLTGEWTRSLYATLGIDVMEQALWVGLVPLLILGSAAREWRSSPGVRIWMVVAAVFGVMALGPFLRVGGWDTALPLPDAILRYVPVFSNARIPGRAVIMVQLAVAILMAHALARRSIFPAVLLAFLVVAEALPSRLPLSPLPSADGVDDELRTSSAAGAVAELPLGLRDGFVDEGVFDHRALVHQMAHGRALSGGFVARLAPGVRQVYADTAVLSLLVRVSTPSETDYRLPDGAADQASASGIAFLVVNRDTFVSARLPRAELERAGFRLVRASGPRELYASGGQGGQQGGQAP